MNIQKLWKETLRDPVKHISMKRGLFCKEGSKKNHSEGSSSPHVEKEGLYSLKVLQGETTSPQMWNSSSDVGKESQDGPSVLQSDK